jgi:hypothetical protein
MDFGVHLEEVSSQLRSLIVGMDGRKEIFRAEGRGGRPGNRTPSSV